MMEAGVSEVLDAPMTLLSEDTHPLIDALRLEGAHQLDPVRFHYIAVLAQRASAHQGSVKRILDGKLDAAVAELRERLAHAQNNKDTHAKSDAESASMTRDTSSHRETLADLVRHMAQHSPQKMDGRVGAHLIPRTELKSVTYFRNTWSKLSAEKQVTQALGQAPKNAGPINSHVVALRSLALMRDTSPDYLNRFMSYVDTLIRLDQGDTAAPPTAKAATKPARPAAKRRTAL